MAARLTDEQKKRIISDYVQVQSYNAVANAHGVAPNTVKKLVQENAEIAELCKKKNEENTVDILEYMESQRETVCKIIQKGLEVLPSKIENAKSASEVTTAIGTLIDKFTMYSKGNNQEVEDLSTLADKLKL